MRQSEQRAAFLRAASNGACSPGLSEAGCKYLMAHPLLAHGAEWRIVYRWDSGERIDLFYRRERPQPDPCHIFQPVSVKRAGAAWERSTVSPRRQL